MSLDKEQEFFSDGLAEEIINALAQISGLKVTARTSAFAFRGKEQDIRTIAEALGVRTILEGSVRRSNNRIRVTAQLINATDGYHLWSQRYDREMADIFEVQDEIATAIAAALQVKLTLKPAAAERYRPTLPAYEAYLRARHFRIGSPTMESWERAKALYEEAIALDPGFAAAYSGLAWHVHLLASFGWRPQAEVVPLARRLSEDALALDPSLPDAHAVLALIALFWDYNWTEAERRFALAMARDPVPPNVRDFFALYLLAAGRPLEGAAHVQRAIADDPLFPDHRTIMFLSLWAGGRDGEAVRELHHILEFDQRSATAFFYLALYHASRGEWSEALRHADRSYALAPLQHTAGLLAAVLEHVGDTRRAKELLETLESSELFGVPRALAIFHLIQGSGEKAVDWFEKMIDRRDNMAFFIPRVPYANALRSSSRWSTLADRMNLPPEAR